MKVKPELRFWITAVLSLLLDRLSKFWVLQTLQLKQSLSLWPGVFHITYVTNPGAAFSLFSQGSGWLRWLSLIVSLGLITLALFGPVMSRWEQFGYGFILAGALGNGIDRFQYGSVIDFLDFRWIHFPVFNWADISINLGIACLLWATFPRRRSPAKSR